MTEQSQEVKEVQEVKRIVVLQDGTTADFGKRNTVLQSVDLEANLITFRVFSGEVFNFDLSELPEVDFASLPELIKTIIAYGVTSKIKTSLAGLKVEEPVLDSEGEVAVDGEGNILMAHPIAAAIEEGIKSIKEGKFSTRNSVTDDEEGISDDLKYFAVAAAVFEKYPFFNPVFLPCVKQTESGSLLYNEETPAETVVEIVKFWDGMNRKQRNEAKRSDFFKLVEGYALQELLNQAKI